MNLDSLIGQLDRRARLTISDSFAFTPKPLAFIGPTTGSEVPDTFVRGIQTHHERIHERIWQRYGRISVYSLVSLQGDYTYSTCFDTELSLCRRRIPQQANLLVQHFLVRTFQSYCVGPQFQVTPLDVVSVNLSRISSQL